MRIFLVAAMALVIGCAGDGGSETESRPGRDVGQAVDEVGQAPLVGGTDVDPEHWSEGEPWEPPYGSTFRAYGGDEWSIVADFPQQMNGCGGGQRRVAWRSLGGPLYAGLTTFLESDLEGVEEGALDDIDWVEVEASEPATEGQLILNSCEQPVFKTTEANVLEDFVIEVTEHEPRV